MKSNKGYCATVEIALNAVNRLSGAEASNTKAGDTQKPVSKLEDSRKNAERLFKLNKNHKKRSESDPEYDKEDYNVWSQIAKGFPKGKDSKISIERDRYKFLNGKLTVDEARKFLTKNISSRRPAALRKELIEHYANKYGRNVSRENLDKETSERKASILKELDKLKKARDNIYKKLGYKNGYDPTILIPEEYDGKVDDLSYKINNLVSRSL